MEICSACFVETDMSWQLPHVLLLQLLWQKENVFFPMVSLKHNLQGRGHPLGTSKRGEAIFKYKIQAKHHYSTLKNRSDT